jgi:hypothetical protein
MRIWDIPVTDLCRAHLLGEHRELHAIWSIYLNNKKGYRYHPEVLRWRFCLQKLFDRHEEQKTEMLKRGYSHQSELTSITYCDFTWFKELPEIITPIDRQRTHLINKKCGCCGEKEK